MIAGIADAAPLAETVAELLMSSNPGEEGRALSHSELFHKVPGADREQIVELLSCRTTADIARSDALREIAQTWLGATPAPLGRCDPADSADKSRQDSAPRLARPRPP